ncbi:uncharacterized protein LOC132552935 [Ylistrum balloti]|uniref:uncharacterized protein LOC132552935 n=1 Tax=Ylistrum balloti TaxID=509963 RepID=UPI002905D344|nr:uncharacterized protein LOC132552935 [Ylistrum balloti]
MHIYAASIRCLSCTDVLQPRYCSGIEHCPEGDACVTESYRNRNGEVLFNVGCMSARRCSLTNQQNRSTAILRTDIIGTHVRDECIECCHGDLCNAAGCGTDGFPKERGPICLNCPQSRDPDNCDVISVCLQGEVCHVEEISKFGDLFYKTSCVRETDYQCTSSPMYNPVEIGRRSTGNCFFCCPDDLCNIQCRNTTLSSQFTTPSTTIIPITNKNITLSPTAVQCTTPEPTHHSFKGKEFFLMFLQNYKFQSTLSVTVTCSAQNAVIQIATSDNSTSIDISGSAKQIDLDSNLLLVENGKSSRGVIVTSNSTMSATAFNSYSCCSAEGYAALSIENLDNVYIVGTPNPNTGSYSQYGSQFAVGAPYDNTIVNITLSTPGVFVQGQYYRKDDTITVVLNKLDTFYIENTSDDQELTGTRIVSNKPVAVVSGNICLEYNGCNHVVEYLPPVSKWGSKFIVPPFKGSNSGYIRIIASYNNTSVIVLSGTLNHTYKISDFIDIDINPSQPSAISSDKPVLVLLIFHQVDIAMSVIPSLNQFSGEPVLISPPTDLNSKLNNTFVVSVRSCDQFGLQIRCGNSTNLSPSESVNYTDVDGEVFSFFTFNYNNNQTCSVQHTNSNVFSVTIYGQGNYEAYAYPVNLML